jgi:hypothetical protein
MLIGGDQFVQKALYSSPVDSYEPYGCQDRLDVRPILLPLLFASFDGTLQRELSQDWNSSNEAHHRSH